MKKWFLSVFLCFLCAYLCACESLPNMNELLSYQKKTAEIEAFIRDETEFHAIVRLENEAVSLTLTDEQKTEGIAFFSAQAEHLEVVYDGVRLELSDNGLTKASAWIAAFRLPTEALWKIKKDTIGGISVYICEHTDAGITVYFDAATLLPLKIQRGAAEIHILSANVD